MGQATHALPPLAREPLLHFLAISLVIFAVDAAVGPGANDERVILIDDELQSELVQIFKEGQGRDPTPEEMNGLVDRWLQNEIMYREARALDLDKGDEMIRQRLILKMRSVMSSNIIADPPGEAALRSWFEANRDRYEQPARYDFAQFLYAKPDERQIAEELAGELAVDEVPPLFDNFLRSYKGRTREQMEAMFGVEFVEELIDGGGERWHLLQSERGWHLARLDGVRQPTVPDFDRLRTRIEADYLLERERQDARAAYREMLANYTIERGSRS